MKGEGIRIGKGESSPMSLVALEFIILQSCSLGEMGGGQPLCSYISHWPQAVGNGLEGKSVMC